METNLELLRETFNKLGVPFREQTYTPKDPKLKTVTWIQMCKPEEKHFGVNTFEQCFSFDTDGKLTGA